MVQTLLVNVPLANAFLLALAFLLVDLTRFAYQFINSRRILRHVPGPPPSSFLWGEEWRLYNSIPGSLYATWHNQFGKVVKFRGAFGVRRFFFERGRLTRFDRAESGPLDHRPSGDFLHRW